MTCSTENDRDDADDGELRRMMPLVGVLGAIAGIRDGEDVDLLAVRAKLRHQADEFRGAAAELELLGRPLEQITACRYMADLADRLHAVVDDLEAGEVPAAEDRVLSIINAQRQEP